MKIRNAHVLSGMADKALQRQIATHNSGQLCWSAYVATTMFLRLHSWSLWDHANGHDGLGEARGRGFHTIVAFHGRTAPLFFRLYFARTLRKFWIAIFHALFRSFLSS